MDQQYPRFSDEEYARRHAAVRDLLQAEDLVALVLYGTPSYAQGEVQYLTNYATTREAYLIFPTDSTLPATLFVQMYNHVPTARHISCIHDVRWAGSDSAATTATELRNRGLDRQRIGISGRIPYQQMEVLRAYLPHVQWIEVGPALTRLRIMKSAEERAMLQRGAQFCDLAVAALEREARPGIPEYALAAIVQDAYLAAGGRAGIQYMATTPMANPSVCVPAQYLSSRILERGDVLITELSAQVMEGYAGQIHRPFAIGAPPTPAYQRLFAVALEAFQRVCAVIRPGATSTDVLDAAEYIHDQGYTIYDDLVHGYGGGYLPPILRTRRTAGSETSTAGVTPPFTFAEDMVIVVQPNVITSDERMGVQVGELLRVTASGVESLHHMPMRFLQCGG